MARRARIVRAKFDVGPHQLGLAARLLMVRGVDELPRMLRRIAVGDMVAYFEQIARELVRLE